MTSRDSYVPPAETIRKAFGEISADDLTFVARLCLELGAWDHALALCEALGRLDTPGVRLCEAVARFVSGDTRGGLEITDRLLERAPGHLSTLFVRAQMLARSGDPEGAQQQLLPLLERYPDFPGGQGMLATLLMPGPHYREILARVHSRLRPRCYLEVGVDTGLTLALARFSQAVVGIDPAERPLQAPAPQGAQLFREQSDTFFRTRSREQVLGALRVDLGFIDGQHLFENALSDFANLERWSDPDGTIILHDCVPILRESASRERSTKFWVGDTWKVVPALARFRPDLRIRTVLAPPSGLVIVRRLNPRSSQITDRLPEILESLRDAEWTHAPGALPPEYGAVSNDERGLSEALG